MQKKLSILFVLVLLVSVSGCTTLESGNGVVIKEFTTDFNEVISGERADFYLKIKNIGSQTAENVFAEIYGLDFGWKEIESGMKCPNEKPISLIAPNTLYGTEGEEKVCIWSYTASDVPAGMSTTYEPKARVFYDYQTDAVIGLTLVSREEMIRLQNSGKAPQIDVLSKTSSPIDVAVNLQTPIRVSGNEASFILGITVTNVGEGVPCLKGRCKSSAGYPIEDPKTDYVTVNIDLCSVGLSQGDFVGPPDASYCKKSVDVPLYRGSNTIQQNFDITIGNILTTQQKTIKINIDYTYYVDKKISVDVVG